MKNRLKNLLQAAGLLALCLFVFQSCSKDENPTGQPGNFKVTYRVTGSEGVQLSTIAFRVGDNTNTETSVSGNTWTSSEVEVSQLAVVSANALGANAQSTLRTEILINGQVVKDGGLSTGEVLTSSASYSPAMP